MALLIGLDIGTSGTKGIAVHSDSGEVVASSTREYPLYTPQPRWAEQDGNDFYAAAIGVLSDLRSKLGAAASDVSGIGLTGQMHSAMLLDSEGKLLRRAILWCDTRTSDECREITEKLGLDGLRRTVKNLALEGFTIPKLLWLQKHEPALFAQVKRVVMPKDWIGFRLTGELGADVSDASGTLAFDPQTRTWSREMLSAIDIDPGLFPEARESSSLLGKLTSEAARATGFAAGLPVARGAADNAAGAVGLGVVRAGRAMVSIGTSGVVLAHTDELRVDKQMRLHTFDGAVPGRSYLMGVMLAAGGALRWYRDVIAHKSYDEITTLAAKAPRGARGIVFLPYLMGERTPHNDGAARGAFVGLTAAAGEAELARAVIEGISFGLGDSLDIMRGLEQPLSLDELRLTGGGAKSAAWRQILADVFGTKVVVTSSTEGPAYGAAILAGAATGVYGSVEEGADRVVRVVDKTEPNADAAAFYREAHKVYRGLYGDLKGRFVELGKWG